MVIGRPGSGKTHFSNRLGELTGRKVIHLDKYYWKPGWVKAYPSSEVFRERVRELASGSEWIIDGNFAKSIDVRLKNADTVVFFDFPAWRAVLGAYKRWFLGGNNFVDKHPGMRERVSFKLLQMMLFYKTTEVYKMLNAEKGKKVYVVKNREDSEQTLREISSR